MGRFNDNPKSRLRNRPVDENHLRQPEADKDLTASNYYQNKINDSAYTSTNAGFQVGRDNRTDHSVVAANPSSEKMSYLKAEIDYMVDGFMRELFDFNAFDNLDEQIQAEIMNRYPQFFK